MAQDGQRPSKTLAPQRAAVFASKGLSRRWIYEDRAQRSPILHNWLWELIGAPFSGSASSCCWRLICWSLARHPNATLEQSTLHLSRRTGIPRRRCLLAAGMSVDLHIRTGLSAYKPSLHPQNSDIENWRSETARGIWAMSVGSMRDLWAGDRRASG
jgi:hypothetical protein